MTTAKLSEMTTAEAAAKIAAHYDRRGEEVTILLFDGAQAAAPLMVWGGKGWGGTPMQVADFRHRSRDAVRWAAREYGTDVVIEVGAYYHTDRAGRGEWRTSVTRWTRR